MEIIKDLDIVALTEDLEVTHFETKQMIKLLKGQVGTVVMEFDGSAFEVEFSHQDGTTYAMETIPATKLMLLHYEFVPSCCKDTAVPCPYGDIEC
ncbi:DUF4926 domain-containing protein [Tychonema sp. BBK16]|uniref:DUF4926 domain-containing protein n=1 Tax=Tychonema sp. BBK16 TaxID=2699888 RepID=UPI001F279E3D|nr:DUF4926 domain-containing protein [Tychonema sp. BBK16]MCF6373432.1 DUF4926 domain-containing protein [Tychonema sp. BBK16]